MGPYMLNKGAKTAIAALAILLLAVAQFAHAEGDAASKPLKIPGIRVAQLDSDDSYDPFADYSEFDEAQDEEADINFFRHGRFVTVGFTGGVRGFTGGLSQMYKQSTAFGAYLSYFFDLRFAVQFSFLTSDHDFKVESPSGKVGRGTISITQFGLDLKYYVNTQNVTKGLAKFNPYIIGGFSRVDRTTNLQDVAGFGKDGANGWDIGVGIELPMLRNKMYFGGQVMYQLVSFNNESKEVEFDGGDKTGKFANGDTYTLLGVLGVNF